MTSKKFPLCEKYFDRKIVIAPGEKWEDTLFERNIVEPALSKAYEQGKLDLFKEVEQLICGTSTIDALEGGVIGLDCYYLNADKFNRLKSQLSKTEKESGKDV
jgi:hypothetical protein